MGWGHYLAGGMCLGLGVGLLFVLTGRIGGMSAVFTTSWSWFSRRAYFQQQSYVRGRVWRVVFALGMVCGAALWCWALGPAGGVVTGVPTWQLLVGGVLVGYGARRSGGCSAGHGICGLASLQLPSLLAVLTFMSTAFVAANLMAWFGFRA